MKFLAVIQKTTLVLILFAITACAAKKIEGEGTESRENIRAVLRKAMPEIKTCYEKELSAQPKLEGKLVVSFTVGDLGKVIDTKIKRSTLKNENIHKCIAATISGLTFPEPPTGNTVVVDYPLIFASNPAKTTEIPKSED